MTTLEASVILGVEQATINQLVRRGKLDAERVGSVLDVTARSVREYRDRRIADLLSQVEAMKAAWPSLVEHLKAEEA